MVIRSRKSLMNRWYNGQKIKYKNTNNDKQHTTQKNKDQATRTRLEPFLHLLSKTPGKNVDEFLLRKVWKYQRNNQKP